MAKEIKLNIVNATALDPSKTYLIELNRLSFTPNDAANLFEMLKRRNIEAVICLSNGGDSVHVKETQ